MQATAVAGWLRKHTHMECMHGQAIRRNCLLISSACHSSQATTPRMVEDTGIEVFLGIIPGTCLIGLNSMNHTLLIVCLTPDRWLTVYWESVVMAGLPKARHTAWKLFFKFDFIPHPPSAFTGYLPPLCSKPAQNILLGVDKTSSHGVTAGIWLVPEQCGIIVEKSMGFVIAITEHTNFSTWATGLTWASDFSWPILG